MAGKYGPRTRSPTDGSDVRWYFCKTPLGHNEPAAAVPPSEIVGKGDYFRFSKSDSDALEAAFLEREEELVRAWWKEYAETREGPSNGVSSSDLPLVEIVESDTKHFESSRSWQLTALEEEENVGVLVKGGLYEVDLLSRRCSPVYWRGDHRRVLRGHWFARKGGLDWLPLREDISEQLEIAYESQIWRRRQFQPSGLYAARVNLHGATQGLHALFTGEDHSWEAWLSVDSSGISLVLGLKGSGVRIRRGFSLPESPQPTQDEIRQQKEEESDDYASKVPVRHVVFMVHGIGQRLEKANLVDDVGTFRRTVAMLAEHHLTQFQRDSQRVLFIPCQWRRELKLGGESAVEDCTLEGVRALRTMLSATVHDVLYYMSPVYCQDIIDSVSHSLNRLYGKFIKRNPNYDGKVSLYGHSLGSVLSYDILCHQNEEMLTGTAPIAEIGPESKTLNEVLSGSDLAESENRASFHSDSDHRTVDGIIPTNADYRGSDEVESGVTGTEIKNNTDFGELAHKNFSQEISGGDVVPKNYSEGIPVDEVTDKNFSQEISGGEVMAKNYSQEIPVDEVTQNSFSEEMSVDEVAPKNFSQEISEGEVTQMNNRQEVSGGEVTEVEALKAKVKLLEEKLSALMQEQSANNMDQSISLSGASPNEEHATFGSSQNDLCEGGERNCRNGKLIREEPSDSGSASDKRESQLYGSLSSRKHFTPHISYTKLDFEVDTFYAVGSPLGVFLSLRNIRIGVGMGQEYWHDDRIEEEMPAVRQMMNIFHPYDPVAYRLEPLVCREYVKMRPTFIPYHKGGKRLHIGMQELQEDLSARSKAIVNSLSSVGTRVASAFSTSGAAKTDSEDHEKLYKEKTYGELMMERLTGFPGGRLDYQLQDATFEHQYISVLSSHTAYWHDLDTALFILKHLYKDIPEEPPAPVDIYTNEETRLNVTKEDSEVPDLSNPEDAAQIIRLQDDSDSDEVSLTFSSKDTIAAVLADAKRVKPDWMGLQA